MKEKLQNCFTGDRVSTLYKLALFYFILFFIFRLTMLIYFRQDLGNVEGSAILKALYLGSKFDLRLISFILLPTIIFYTIKSFKNFWNKFNLIFHTFIVFLTSSVFIIDLAYYDYLRSRVNSTILQFFKNPIISAQMVNESYPWILFVIIVLTITVLCFFIIKKSILTLAHYQINNFKKSFLAGFIFILLWGLSIYGSLTAYPLRWSEAFNSPNQFTSNLGLNPILYVFDTYTFRNADYSVDEVRKNYHLVAEFLGVNPNERDEKSLNFIRKREENLDKKRQRPNFVVIIMESLAKYKTGLGGSAVNPTPNLDKLSKDSMYFKNFYTPTVATARSVFAAVTSLADVSKVKTGSRNPFIVNQHTNIAELTEHDKFYFLGGSANWGNIRGVLSYNIPGLNIYEEGSYNSPRVDVWGISDLDLFKEAHKILKEQDKNPFFAIIQTAGFHRPYTIPEDNDGFKTYQENEVDMKEIGKYGFESLAEYNAMRLQDHSLGKFIELAKKEKYFNNTIFVIFGDHGLPHNGAPNVKDWARGQANGYHVPLLIYSPKFIQPMVQEKIASELDVMPTIAGIAGVKTSTRSLGKDLLDPFYDEKRAAFSYNWYAPFHISLIDQNYYFEMIPSSENGTLKKWNSDNSNEELREKEPQKYEEMKKLTKALYETSKYLMHNNPKIK